MSSRRRLFAVVQLLLAVVIFIGSSFEVVNLLFPGLVPAIQDAPLMRLHHSVRPLFYWTVLSNLASAFFAAQLLRGAVGTLRGRTAASELSRRALGALIIIVAGGALVSLVYLLPPILAMLRAPQQHATGFILLLSVVGSVTGMAAVLSGLLLGHGVIQRHQSLAEGRVR